jgi:hypothetical protein
MLDSTDYVARYVCKILYAEWVFRTDVGNSNEARDLSLSNGTLFVRRYPG